MNEINETNLIHSDTMGMGGFQLEIHLQELASCEAGHVRQGRVVGFLSISSWKLASVAAPGRYR